MRFLLTGVAMLIAGFGLACLWDSDTVAAELKGMPELQDVIAGRFERNPDLYYEMRLAREAEMNRNPFLDEYFDLAVASDRLGRHDDAIEWIERFDREAAKEKVTSAEWKDLSYKRTANLGTFYIHRGLKKGNEGLADLKKGLDLIEKAIVINPEAHFGREKVQVTLVKNIISEMEGKPFTDTGLTKEEIREGVIGLMVLGNAWEAPIAWEWLAGTLDEEDSHAASMLGNRINELDPEFEWYSTQLPEPLFLTNYGAQDGPRTEQVYNELRANGRKWHQNREEFMLAKLKAGKHPDTDKDFWEGYKELPRYTIVETVPGGSFDPEVELTFMLKVVGGSCITLFLVVVGLIFWLRKRMVLNAERVNS